MLCRWRQGIYIPFIAGSVFLLASIVSCTASPSPTPSEPRSCLQVDKTTGVQIALEPCPGDYLDCDDLAPGIILESVVVVTSTCEQDYFSVEEETANVKSGDPCLMVYGGIKNERSEAYYVGISATGYDSVENPVSWTMDCAHICGSTLTYVDGHDVDGFALHLNAADNIKSIEIHTGCYSTPPP
jgi:hypothetical protein